MRHQNISARWGRPFRAITAGAIAFGLAAGAQAQVLSDGPNSPSAIVSDGSFGTSAWTSPGNAAASDNVPTGTTPLGFPTQYLKATSFGFAIPSPAEIVGIEVFVERRSVSGTVSDSRARIVKGGVVGSAERALVGLWPTTDATATYGSSSDLWGQTWTPADINSSGFGFALSAIDGVDTAAVDHISITVHYSLCASAPAAGCRVALKSIFLVKDKTPDTKDKLIWKWIKGANTSTADFSDPTTTANYALCVYTGSTAALTAEVLVPPSITKWSAIGVKGFKYLDKTGAEDGIQKVILKSSTVGKSKILVKGKGTNLPTVTPPLDLPVVVQVVNSDSGVCWEGTYILGDVKKNIAGQFKAKAD